MIKDYAKIAENVFETFSLRDKVSCILNDLNDRHVHLTKRLEPIVIVGPSRAGKDTLSLLLMRLTHHRYNGSCSINSAYLVHEAWNCLFPHKQYPSTKAFFNDRHPNKVFWFEFLNALRDIETTTVSALALEHSDILTGVRSLSELQSIRPYVSKCVWVENPRVPVDPTLQFGWHDCADLFGNDCIVISNRGDHRDFLTRFLVAMPKLPVQFQIVPRDLPLVTASDLPIGG